MEYAKTRNIYEKCKNSEIASKNLLWWEANYYSDDAAGGSLEPGRRSIKIAARASSTHTHTTNLDHTRQTTMEVSTYQNNQSHRSINH